MAASQLSMDKHFTQALTQQKRKQFGESTGLARTGTTQTHQKNYHTTLVALVAQHWARDWRALALKNSLPDDRSDRLQK